MVSVGSSMEECWHLWTECKVAAVQNCYGEGGSLKFALNELRVQTKPNTSTVSHLHCIPIVSFQYSLPFVMHT